MDWIPSLAALVGGLLGGFFSAYRAAAQGVDPDDKIDDRWELRMGLGKIALYGAIAGVLVVSTGDKLIDLSQIGIDLGGNWLVSFAVGALGGISSDQVIGQARRKLGLAEALAEAKTEGTARITEEMMALQQSTAAAIVAKAAQTRLAQVAPSIQVVGQVEGAATPQVPTPTPSDMAVDTLLEQQTKTMELLKRLNQVQRAKSVGQVRAVQNQRS